MGAAYALRRRQLFDSRRGVFRGGCERRARRRGDMARVVPVGAERPHGQRRAYRDVARRGAAGNAGFGAPDAVA